MPTTTRRYILLSLCSANHNTMHSRFLSIICLLITPLNNNCNNLRNLLDIYLEMNTCQTIANINEFQVIRMDYGRVKSHRTTVALCPLHVRTCRNISAMQWKFRCTTSWLITMEKKSFWIIQYVLSLELCIHCYQVYPYN